MKMVRMDGVFIRMNVDLKSTGTQNNTGYPARLLKLLQFQVFNTKGITQRQIKLHLLKIKINIEFIFITHTDPPPVRKMLAPTHIGIVLVAQVSTTASRYIHIVKLASHNTQVT
jgi:hypothetical protein